jgi:flagellar motor protein MotB
MNRRRSAMNVSGMESLAFVAMSDVFINVAFILLAVLVIVTLSSSSALKQIQLNSEQTDFINELEAKHLAITPKPNGNLLRIVFSDSSTGKEGLFFAQNSTVLEQAGKTKIDSIAGLLLDEVKSKRVSMIEVEGDTDTQKLNDGPLKQRVIDSWGLSTERADAVVRELQKQGIDPNKYNLAAVGRGQFNPYKDDDASSSNEPRTLEEKYARDRRIEIVLIYDDADSSGNESPK